VINATQEIILSLIEEARYNNLDGARVAADLRANADLWKAVLLTRLNSLIQLRDLPRNIWNADSLFILTTDENLLRLEALAQSWQFDEAGVLSDDEAQDLLGEYPTSGKIYNLWWD
jgi:hypothetical protein